MKKRRREEEEKGRSGARSTGIGTSEHRNIGTSGSRAPSASKRLLQCRASKHPHRTAIMPDRTGAGMMSMTTLRQKSPADPTHASSGDSHHQCAAPPTCNGQTTVHHQSCVPCVCLRLGDWGTGGLGDWETGMAAVHSHGPARGAEGGSFPWSLSSHWPSSLHDRFAAWGGLGLRFG